MQRGNLKTRESVFAKDCAVLENTHSKVFTSGVVVVRMISGPISACADVLRALLTIEGKEHRLGARTTFFPPVR